MKHSKFTDAELMEDYEDYCEDKKAMGEVPLTFDQWKEANSACWDDSYGPNPYVEEK